VDWEWCHGCGFDPDGKLAAARAQGQEPVLTGAPPAAGAAFPGTTGPVPPAGEVSASPSADAAWGDDDWAVDPMTAAGPTARTVADVTAVGGPNDGLPVDPPAAPTMGSAFPSGWDAPVSPVSPGEVASPEVFGADAHRQPVYEQPVYEQPVYDQPVHEEPAPVAAGPSSFLDDVPTPAELGSGAPVPAATAGAPTGPTGRTGPTASTGFSPTGWQNDPPKPRPEGALNPKASGPKTPVLIAVAVIVVVVIGAIFVKMGSNDRPSAQPKTTAPNPADVDLNKPPSTLPPTTVAAGWAEYRASDGTYVAGFPVKPEQSNVTITIGERTLTAVEVRAQAGPYAPAFAIDTIPIPADLAVPDPQTAFDLLSSHFQVTASEPYSVNGLDGVRFTARRDGADLTGVVFVQGGRIFYLAEAGADQASFDSFASSFQLKTR
jgi:hypothetical protein